MSEKTPPPVEETPDKTDDLPEGWQREVKRLREENASRRVALKALEDKASADAAELERLRKAEEARTAEQGDFRKLYEEAKPRLDVAAKLEAEVKGYQSYFQSQLDAVLDGLDDGLKTLVQSSNLPIQERLEMARKLKGPSGEATSPASVRPGGGLKPEGDLVKRMSEARTAGDKARILTEAKLNHPKLYPTLLQYA